MMAGIDGGAFIFKISYIRRCCAVLFMFCVSRPTINPGQIFKKKKTGEEILFSKKCEILEK